MLSSDRLGRLSPEQRALLPAPHAQERMWFLSRFDPGGCLHNLSYVQQADNERTPPAVRY